MLSLILLVLIISETTILLRSAHRPPTSTQDKESEKPLVLQDTEPQILLPVQDAYKKSWIFTYAEKDAYRALKPIAEEYGYTVFAKVRLLDLVKPIRKNKKYQTYFNKVQSKHVDFVLCNEKLVAEWIIELDDSTHDRPDRRERDSFVDAVVTSVGYRIIHTRTIDNRIKNALGTDRKVTKPLYL